MKCHFKTLGDEASSAGGVGNRRLYQRCVLSWFRRLSWLDSRRRGVAGVFRVLGSAGQVGFGSKSVQNNALTFALWSSRFFPLESTSYSAQADEGCLHGCFIVEK